ncbi:CRISPR-associated helicase/endonuclease Cas3 [Pseudorhodoferax sp. Leaf267]|uniref:CRISPR-associated helicase/endonuclease Cas3 n=1 Tax=Pseudorhodoferax sp. Leaf267 TaxID=1736316 RepID=UPI000700F997|nr:CRISPR-associated helicase/endonuclease Cas3 [Pseudorhodoferax sp. Leaf267]KQP21728.1 CRISPR-associated protein [Pseudorhodoferax sp. Leaf267]
MTEPVYIAHHRASDGAWQSLESHLLGVATLARGFASKLHAGDIGELLGLLHDIGKYSREFQAYLKSATGALDQDADEDWVDSASLKGKVDHSTAGAQWIWQLLSQRGPQAQVLAQVAALCVASHHSGLIDCVSGDGRRFGDSLFLRRMDKPDQRTHLAEVLGSMDPSVRARCNELLSNTTLANELFALLSAIGNHRVGAQAVGGAVALQQMGLVVRFLFSCLIDADRIDTADFESPRGRCFRPIGAYGDWQHLIDRYEVRLAEWPVARPIDHLRRSISQACLDAAARPRGIYTLTVPTGGGKTLASLRYALHHAKARKLDRIVFVIPFTSISDQNAEVVRAVLEPEGDAPDAQRIVLEHHGSVTPERQTWREKILCENWDAPVVYTTMVQFLEALFGAGTRGARRMHQLANAVIVFDEIQTLPIRCVHLFNNAVNFLAERCNSTVVLCTATQPLLHTVKLEAGAMHLEPGHEIMDDVGALFTQLKRVDVRDARRPGGWSHSEIAELALQELQRTGSCLVIVNTKRSAQVLYELAAGALDADLLCHLSTDMCPAHRKHELQRVRDRLAAGLPTLCISTQLIEAGVDVDFRVVIRFLAGLDSIAQAAGRCNRNGRPEPGVLHIVNPDEESLRRLPDILQGRTVAEHVLGDYRDDPARYGNNHIGPQALQDYYRRYFYQRQSEMAYPIPTSQLGRDDTLLDLLSINELAVKECARQNGSAPPIPLRQAFMTAAEMFKAIDAPTQGIVVPYGPAGQELVNDLFAAYDLTREGDLLRRAQQFTVNVFPHVLRKLSEAKALKPAHDDLRITCLDPRFYSLRFGLSTEPVNRMETPIA